MTDREELDKVFVEKWLEAVERGLRADWIGEELRLPKNYVLNKAQTLRRRGVKLPLLRSGRYNITKEQVADLNKLIGGLTS